MPLHFSEDEFAQRRRRVTRELERRGLAGLLVFKQETMYYLTAYDSFGYVFFQCLYFGGGGELTLLTRLPDLRQAEHTSNIRDIRVWKDAADADPTAELLSMCEGHALKGERIGIELDAYGLSYSMASRIQARLEDFCELEDASDLVDRLRAIKTPSEVGYRRRAAALADAALEQAEPMAVPGAFEGDILAEMQSAVFRGDGDYPANAFIIGSGRDALLCRYYAGRRNLDSSDQLMLEFAGSYRHYHAALMRVIVVGQTQPAQLDMYRACRDALEAAGAALAPGHTLGEAFEAHAEVIDCAGFEGQRLNACGYGLGATFSATWVDWPWLHAGNSVVAEPGMAIFLDMFLMDEKRGLVMALGETVLVNERGIERLSGASLDLVVN